MTAQPQGTLSASFLESVHTGQIDRLERELSHSLHFLAKERERNARNQVATPALLFLTRACIHIDIQAGVGSRMEALRAVSRAMLVLLVRSFCMHNLHTYTCNTYVYGLCVRACRANRCQGRRAHTLVQHLFISRLVLLFPYTD